MRVDTTQYEASHGKRPKGYGFWFMEVTLEDVNGNRKVEKLQETGTLRDVKERAVVNAALRFKREFKAVEVKVLP